MFDLISGLVDNLMRVSSSFVSQPAAITIDPIGIAANIAVSVVGGIIVNSLPKIIEASKGIINAAKDAIAGIWRSATGAVKPDYHEIDESCDEVLEVAEPKSVSDRPKYNRLTGFDIPYLNAHLSIFEKLIPSIEGEIRRQKRCKRSRK